MRSRSDPFVSLQANKMALPQGVLPPPAPPSNVPATPAAVAPARAPRVLASIVDEMGTLLVTDPLGIKPEAW